MRTSPAHKALVFALAVAGCTADAAATSDTEMIACSHLRCDNPNPNTCACPDDTDGIVTNTPTEPQPDPESSGTTSGSSSSITPC